MRIFCPAIVLSSSLLVVPPSQTVARRATPVALLRRATPTPEVGRVALSRATRDLLDLVGGAPDSPGPAGRRAGGSPGSVRTQTGPRVQESLFSRQVIFLSRAARAPARATGLSCHRP